MSSHSSFIPNQFIDCMFNNQYNAFMSRPREFDYNQVLHAAIDVFNEYGYNGSSYELLTERTQLKKQSLYGAFGDKKSLFEKSLSLYCDEFLSRFQKLLTHGSTAIETLRYLQQHLLVSNSGRNNVGCFVVNSALELTDPDYVHVKIQFDKMFQGMWDSLNRVILQGQQEDSVIQKSSSEQLALYMTNSIIGIRVMIRAGIPKVQIQATLDAAIETLLV